MLTFRELDVVRVVRLVRPARKVGTTVVLRQPRVRDVGTIVRVLGPSSFIVECANDEGRTVWLADFEAEELELEPSGRAPR
jgi:hypothetical protein